MIEFGSGSLRSLPQVTKHLLIINIVLWLLTILLQGTVDLTSLLGLHYYKGSDFNPLQLFTYMFMHSTQGLGHIFFNMFALFMFGGLIERIVGSNRFLFYYIVCGLGAGLVQEVTWHYTLPSMVDSIGAAYGETDYYKTVITQGLSLDPLYNELITVGASGAVFGLLLAVAFFLPDLQLYLFFIGPFKAKWLVLGYAIIELLLGLGDFAWDNVAHFAHLGGMLFGFFVLLYWYRKNIGRHDRFY